ncbi:hypothetical protein PBPMD00_11 [Pinkberry virus LS07-2018-MD00]|nr:hypothetical protein PBPMD00_11 [Pinkberry virus LS07-2018-MD00]
MNKRQHLNLNLVIDYFHDLVALQLSVVQPVRSPSV